MDAHVSQKYLQQQVLTASPAKLVAMLLDRAISLLNEAVEAIAAGQIERRWKANSKASEIVCQLWESLDLEQGGEVAANLNRLYGFIMQRLRAVDLQNDAQAAREVIGLLEPLRRSWHELAESAPRGPRPAANTSNPHATAKITVSA